MDTNPAPTRLLRRVAARALGLLVAMLSCVAVSAATAPAAQAAGFTEGAITVNCSWGSCSYYFSRSSSKELDSRAAVITTAGTGAVTTACGALGVAAGAATSATGPVAVAIGGAVTGACGTAGGTRLALMMNALHEAASTQEHPPNGACFKITIPHGMPGSAYFSTNMGKYCKN